MPLGAVTLDAAGTLVEIAEPVGTTYARIAARHGIALVPDEVERRFRAAFGTAPPLAFPAAAGNLAAHERAWWRARVRDAFGAAGATPGFDAAFTDLFAHYAEAAAWRVFPDAPPALAALRARGLGLAVVSNFDGRLPRLLDGLGLRPLVDHVVHSTAAGTAKPDPGIFRAALAALGVAPAAALHGGDDARADVAGARAAGLRAVLIDRRGGARPPPGAGDVPVIAALDALPALVDALGA